MHLSRLKPLIYLDEVLVLPLKSGYGASISAQLIGQGVLFLDYAAKHIFAIVEELVQFARCGQHLRSRIDQFEEVGPRFVQVIFPFGNGCSVRVTCAH